MKRVLKSKSNIKKADRILRKRNVSKAQQGGEQEEEQDFGLGSSLPWSISYYGEPASEEDFKSFYNKGLIPKNITWEEFKNFPVWKQNQFRPGLNIIDYFNSPIVKRRLENQYLQFNPNATQEEVQRYVNDSISSRINNVNTLSEIPWSEFQDMLREKGFTEDQINAYNFQTRGTYLTEPHAITFNPADDPQRPGLAQSVYGPNTVLERLEGTPRFYTKQHETYHGSNRATQTLPEFSNFFNRVLSGKYTPQDFYNASLDDEGKATGNSYLKWLDDNTRYSKRVNEIGARIWELRNAANRLGIIKDGEDATPEQISKLLNLTFSPSTDIPEEEKSKWTDEDWEIFRRQDKEFETINNTIDTLKKLLDTKKTQGDTGPDSEETFEERLQRAMNYFVDTEGKDNSAVSTAKQGGVISKKQLGGLASLPFNRLIKNKNMENSFKYQQGGFSSLLEQMINEPRPSFSTKSAEGNQYLSMPINDQRQYFQKLSQYVSDYGVEALSQNPEAEEFFFEFSKKTAAPAVPNARFSTDPPVQGGTYVSATVSAKRVEQDPIKDFIRSPKIQSENFQNFSETKIPEILLEDYEVSVSMPKSMGFINSDTLADLGLKTTVYGPEISESKRTLKRVKQAKNGGNIYSKMGLKPMGIFNSGGTVSPAFQRNMPVGNSKRIDGYIPMDNLIPIQTERDELIVLPSKDVVKVNATKRHSKMTDDEVTDIVPDGSYILSQYGDVDIYKEEADNYIIETKNKPYNLHQQNQPPSIKTLGSFMSKKKMKPADLARKILAKYKTVNLDDPFVNDTNRANKFTASRYLDAIIELSELDKKRKGLDENPEAQMYEQSPEMFARNGGKALKSSYKMPKYEAGAIAGAAAGLLSGVLSAYTDSQNRKLLKQNTAASLADIANLSKRQMGYENLGLAAGLFNPQDPTYREPRYQFGYLQGIRNQGLGNQELDYITNRAFANLNAGQNARTYDAREAASLNSLGYASALDNMSKAGLENARRKDAINIDYYKNLGAGMQFNEAARNKEFNMITANVNKNLADRTAQIMASMGNRQNLLNNEMSLRLAARNQQTPALIQMNNQLAQSLMDSAKLGLQTYSTLNKSAATPTYVGTVGDPNFSYQGPYAPGTRMCQDAKGNIIPC